MYFCIWAKLSRTFFCLLTTSLFTNKVMKSGKKIFLKVYFGAEEKHLWMNITENKNICTSWNESDFKCGHLDFCFYVLYFLCGEKRDYLVLWRETRLPCVSGFSLRTLYKSNTIIIFLYMSLLTTCIVNYIS